MQKFKDESETHTNPKVLGVDINLPESFNHLSGWIYIGNTVEGTPLLLEPSDGFSRILSHFDSTTTSSARADEVQAYIENLQSDGHLNARLPTEEEAKSIIFSQMPAMPSRNDFMDKTKLHWAGYWVEPGADSLTQIQEFSNAAGYPDGNLVDRGLAEFSTYSGEVHKPLRLAQEREGMVRAVQEAPQELAKLIAAP